MKSFRDRIKDSGKVFIVGVGGDSGSGKTTFVKGIKRIFGTDTVSSFSLDDYHLLDRRQRAEKGITPLDPEANDLKRLAEDLRKLRAGTEIRKPVYDHSNGTFGEPVAFKPTPIVIIEGLHPFYTGELRQLSDFKVYVNPSREVKKKWKLKRDVGERGHKTDDVLAEMRLREADYERHVDEQKVYAEVIVEIGKSAFELNDVYRIRLIQRMLEQPLEEMDLSIDLSQILRLSKRNFSLEFERDDIYGSDVGILSMDGEMHRDVVGNLESRICHYTGRDGRCLFDSGEEYLSTTELAQLIICWRFMEKIDYILSGE